MIIFNRAYKAGAASNYRLCCQRLAILNHNHLLCPLPFDAPLFPRFPPSPHLPAEAVALKFLLAQVGGLLSTIFRRPGVDALLHDFFGVHRPGPSCEGRCSHWVHHQDLREHQHCRAPPVMSPLRIGTTTAATNGGKPMSPKLPLLRERPSAAMAPAAA